MYEFIQISCDPIIGYTGVSLLMTRRHQTRIIKSVHRRIYDFNFGFRWLIQSKDFNSLQPSPNQGLKSMDRVDAQF